MGTFSKFERYHEAGEAANVNNTARYGQPVKSLFTTTKVLSIHAHIDITDADENVLYKSDTSPVSLHARTSVTDAAGKQICSIIRKVMTIHGRHVVTMADGKTFELATELLHIVKSVTDIDGLGWKLNGNIAGLNFELYDEKNRVVAVVGKKMISAHEKTCADIYMPEYETYVVAILVVFQLMIMDQKKTMMVTSGG